VKKMSIDKLLEKVFVNLDIVISV